MPNKPVRDAIGLGAIIGACAGAFKFGEFLHKAHKVTEVKHEHATFMRMIRRVRRDLDECIRLRNSSNVQSVLKSKPEKTTWIDGVLRDNLAALAEIGLYTGRVTEDVEGGGRIGIRNRMLWVLNARDALAHRYLELATCHRSLGDVLAYLVPLEPAYQEQEPQAAEYDYQIEEKHEQQYALPRQPEKQKVMIEAERVRYRNDTDDNEPRQQYRPREREYYSDEIDDDDGRDRREEYYYQSQQRPDEEYYPEYDGYAQRYHPADRQGQTATQRTVYRETRHPEQDEYIPDPRPQRLRSFRDYTSKL